MEELKKNQGIVARKRKGEDEDISVNITLSYPARGNSAARSSHEPRYHKSTAGSSNDTRRTKARSEVTSSMMKDWRDHPTYEDQDSDKKLPGETSLGKAVRLDSRKYVQQRDAAGYRPSPAYGDPDFNMSDNARGNPTPEWEESSHLGGD